MKLKKFFQDLMPQISQTLEKEPNVSANLLYVHSKQKKCYVFLSFDALNHTNFRKRTKFNCKFIVYKREIF